MANSKKELLEWLALKPRTAGWGAVVAYDRSKCNTLLLQDYINKFTVNSYLEPINEPVAVGDANWQHLSDWVTDVPRLSFEDSSKAAGGEANMKMAVIGGTQVSIDNTVGHKRAIAVHSIDALDHPDLIAENVVLSKISGQVGKDTGQVVLDLGAAEAAKGEWQLTFANSSYERRIGGEFFKQYFKGADKEKRLYHLGKIAYTDQQYLKPASFRLRTITAQGAELNTADNFGDGAVELFICMEGDQEGGTPPTDDWRSLIPNNGGGEYDSAMLLSNYLLMRRIIAEGMNGMFSHGVKFSETYDDRNFLNVLKAQPSIGVFFLPGFVGHTDSYIVEVLKFAFPAANNDSDGLSITVQDDRTIRFGWGDSSVYRQQKCLVKRRGGEEDSDEYTMNIALQVNADIEFVVDADAGGVVAKVKNLLVDMKLSARYVPIPEVAIYLESARGEYATTIKRALDDTTGLLFGKTIEFNTFVLNSILFAGHETIKQKSAEFPGDMVVFGKVVNPFTVAPLEHLMGHGATHPFTVSGDFAGKVKWSVAAIPGSTGEIGSIDEDTGLYSSPALADISGTFTRVRVTATASNHSSSALVTVVARDITVNPVVQICSASTSEASVTRVLSAHTLGEGILEWKVKRGTGTIPARGGSDGKNTYTAGLKDPTLEGSFLIDEIEVMNLATRKTQTAYVVVTHYQADLTITVDLDNSSFPQGKAKLIARDNRENPVTAIWEVSAGNEGIDSDGLYTGDPDGQQRFVLITARKANDASKEGWIILPWPLFELPNKPEPIDNL
ncbi:hypothetical protein [Pseudomonas sp. MPC6]|uniref:hypothetical protein n=1 Tax=unclassified Pseudomonas TaxID=196821 RepID=UPI0011101725|nr:hypothetical protein [Pseudomonas sp. MPC6]QCY12716.1 hypothetical protein ELQ88_19095 [Pseudomonas sp. MPC6]